MPEITETQLVTAIRVQLGCLTRPTINGFAGTGRSRRREPRAPESIARQIFDRGLQAYSFQCAGELAQRHDAYLTVMKALCDIDDEDARRWASSGQWDAARFEAARDIAYALRQKFTIVERKRTEITTGGVHNHSNWRFEGE